MQTPRINFASLSATDFREIYTDEDQLLTNVSVTDQLIATQSAEHLIIEQSQFEKTTFSAANFFRLEVTDVIFKDCDLSNCQFEKSSWYRVQFINCKLVGTTFDQSLFKAVSFDNCNLNLANLNEMKLVNVTAKDSQLTEINCMETSLKTIHLTNCNLNNADFTNTPLNKSDLRRCEFDALRVQPIDIRGCRVSAAQALYFANQFLALRID